MSEQLTDNLEPKRPSIQERMSAGKVLRKKFPRTMHGEYKPAVNRADPVSILEQQSITRLQELVPIRYARMLQSPFAFLRGAAAIMAADLAANGETTGIHVQLCGDMHVANFGLFATAERNLVFGINDFDETIPGPWEWDLKRLVTSVVVSGRFLGMKEKLCKDAVLATVKSYRRHLKKNAFMGNLTLWYSTISNDDLIKSIPAYDRIRAEEIFNKARTHTNLQMLEKLTDVMDEQHRIRENPPYIIHETHTVAGRPVKEALDLFLASYSASLAPDRKHLFNQYRIVDVARKVVGVGSVGMRCWIIYLEGNQDEDPLFLQMKEAQSSVLTPFVSKSSYENHGQRVVAGQRLIQGAPDIFIGWGEVDGIQFYVRQLRDMKGGIEFDPAKVNPEEYHVYCETCAWALALAHAKSGDAAMLAGYVGSSDVLDHAMVRFAFAYADQNEKDFQLLTAAAKSGKIKIAEAGT